MQQGIEEDFVGGAPAKAFVRSVVEGINEVLDHSIRDRGYVRILGHTLPEKPVGILVGSPLPGRMWVGNEEGHVL